MNWLLLIHQIPAKPSYFRARIWRRLQQVGAVPVKQAVYVMPHLERTYEDLSWIAKEINESNGEAVLLQASFLEGLSDDQVVGLFKKARRADYEKIMLDAQGVMELWHDSTDTETKRLNCKTGLNKLCKALAAVVAIDFFPDGLQLKVDAFLADMEIIFRKSFAGSQQQPEAKSPMLGKTWVTQENVYVDRMASAWFIKKFIDPTAAFKFVKDTFYEPTEDELRFDMMEAEYTHQGDLCTFEVLVHTFTRDNRSLRQLARIIHDIDLKDDTYSLAQTPGVHALLDGIVGTTSDDLERIALISPLLESLLIFFENKYKHK